MAQASVLSTAQFILIANHTCGLSCRVQACLSVLALAQAVSVQRHVPLRIELLHFSKAIGTIIKTNCEASTSLRGDLFCVVSMLPILGDVKLVTLLAGQQGYTRFFIVTR